MRAAQAAASPADREERRWQIDRTRPSSDKSVVRRCIRNRCEATRAQQSATPCDQARRGRHRYSGHRRTWRTRPTASQSGRARPTDRLRSPRPPSLPRSPTAALAASAARRRKRNLVPSRPSPPPTATDTLATAKTVGSSAATDATEKPRQASADPPRRAADDRRQYRPRSSVPGRGCREDHHGLEDPGRASRRRPRRHPTKRRRPSDAPAPQANAAAEPQPTARRPPQPRGRARRMPAICRTIPRNRPAHRRRTPPLPSSHEPPAIAATAHSHARIAGRQRAGRGRASSRSRPFDAHAVHRSSTA